MKLSEIKVLHPDWVIETISDNMNQPVNCAGCGSLLNYGETFTSFERTTDSEMFGLPVCDKCYRVELLHKGIVWNQVR